MDDILAINIQEPLAYSMESFFKQSIMPPQLSKIVEGTVISQERMAVYVDLAPFGIGIIYGREYLNARDILKKINPGDIISTKVVSPENEEGYIELSLKEARQATLWKEADEAIRNKTMFELVVKDANKGGLILDWNGIPGFLPASQLKSEHYPRVEDGDKDKIAAELRNLIGSKLQVSLITADSKEAKLIFSEKNLDLKEKQELVEKYKVGDVLEGDVTGAVDFGVFVRLEPNLEGLVHISEMDWALVENPRSKYRIGDKVQVKIIEIKDGKVSLSIKSLQKNPWNEAEKKYAKGDRVSGVVIKFNKYGSLVSIEEGIAGLVHISDFGNSEEKLRKTIELGKTYPFVITLFEPKEQRLTLSYSEAQKETGS